MVAQDPMGAADDLEALTGAFILMQLTDFAKRVIYQWIALKLN